MAPWHLDRAQHRRVSIGRSQSINGGYPARHH